MQSECPSDEVWEKIMSVDETKHQAGTFIKSPPSAAAQHVTVRWYTLRLCYTGQVELISMPAFRHKFRSRIQHSTVPGSGNYHLLRQVQITSQRATAVRVCSQFYCPSDCVF